MSRSHVRIVVVVVYDPPPSVPESPPPRITTLWWGGRPLRSVSEHLLFWLSLQTEKCHGLWFENNSDVWAHPHQASFPFKRITTENTKEKFVSRRRTLSALSLSCLPIGHLGNIYWEHSDNSSISWHQMIRTVLELCSFRANSCRFISSPKRSTQTRSTTTRWTTRTLCSCDGR